MEKIIEIFKLTLTSLLTGIIMGIILLMSFLLTILAVGNFAHFLDRVLGFSGDNSSLSLNVILFTTLSIILFAVGLFMWRPVYLRQKNKGIYKRIPFIVSIIISILVVILFIWFFSLYGYCADEFC